MGTVVLIVDLVMGVTAVALGVFARRRAPDRPGPWAALHRALDRCADFTGRAGRAEFWWVAWAWVLQDVAVDLVQHVGGPVREGARVGGAVLGLALTLPMASALARRLHDRGRRATWMWIALTGVGVLVLLVWALRASDEGTNRYGPPARDDVVPATQPPPAPAGARVVALVGAAVLVAGTLLGAVSPVPSSTERLGSSLVWPGYLVVAIAVATAYPAALFAPRRRNGPRAHRG